MQALLQVEDFGLGGCQIFAGPLVDGSHGEGSRHFFISVLCILWSFFSRSVSQRNGYLLHRATWEGFVFFDWFHKISYAELIILLKYEKTDSYSQNCLCLTLAKE